MRVQITDMVDREHVVLALAKEGRKVWIEQQREQVEGVKTNLFFVCWEDK